MNNVKLIKDGVAAELKEGKLEEAVAKAQGIAQGLMTKRRFQPADRKTQMERLQADRLLREKAQSKAIPFIDPNVFDSFKLVQGLYLLGGMSGKGKSTTAANVLHGYLKYGPENKKAYVITNEEMSDAVLGRVACLDLGYSYFQYHKNELSRSKKQEVDDHSALLLDRIYVVNDPAFDMSCLEDVQAVLQYAKETGDVGMVLLDYYQTVEHSRDNPDMETFQVLKILGSYLKDYGRKVDVPVVVFAQLRPSSESADMQSRIQNDRTIYNHAFAVIEIEPNFETLRTTFRIHKDRFGEVQGKEIEMEFKNGKYVSTGSL